MGKIVQLFIVLLFSVVFANAEEITENAISFDSPDTYYAEKETEINLSLKNAELAKDGMLWNLKYSGRTIAAGEIAQPQNKIKIKFPFPKLNQGVIASSVFSCTDRQGKNLLTKEIHFYPPNPFANNSLFLTEQKISIWNPSSKGNLKETFKALEVPFEEISSTSQFTGKILIAYGIDFEQFSGIETDIAKLAAKEPIKIIILPPLSGSFKIKSQDYDRIIFARNDIIHEFSKKFDSALWGSTPVPAGSSKITHSDEDISIAIEKKKNGFSFCQLNIGKSKIYICEWDMELSGKSPTPLYLLSKLILNQ